MTARILTAALAGLVLLAAPAEARTVTDSAGRTVAIPDTVTRVFASGPPRTDPPHVEPTAAQGST